MDPEFSLPHLQVPATCPYPEPDQSSSCTQLPNLLPALPLLRSGSRVGPYGHT